MYTNNLYGHRCLGRERLRRIRKRIKTTGASVLDFITYAVDRALAADGEDLPHMRASEAPINPDADRKPIADITLSVRCRRTLEELGIKTVGSLAAHTEEELLCCRHFGQSSLNEIKSLLGAFGLRLSAKPG